MPANPLPRSLRQPAQAVQDAYAHGDPAFFNYLANDCTVYSIGKATPFTSKADFQAYFQPLLTATTRKIKILSQEAKSMQDRCLILKTMQITQDGVIANVRQSSIWHQTNGAWLLEHMHNALVGSPSADAPRNVDAIVPLNERIATVAAVLGVAQ